MQILSTTSGRRPFAQLMTLIAVSTSVAAGCHAASPTPIGSPSTAVATAASSIPEPSTTVGSSVASANASECRGQGSAATLDVRYKHVDGVDADLLSMDIYAPALAENCKPAPMVVFVHGGSFRNGDKANKIGDKVSLFTEQGWVFASVNYRLSPSPPDDTAEQVRYPTHEQDVAAAVAWLQQHAGDYNGDPARIMLVGHSSGAFIVSLLSTDTTFLEAAGVDISTIGCTVALDTEYDITSQVAQGGSQEILYRNAFGNDPATWAQGSPFSHAGPGSSRPDFLIFTQGPARRTAQAQRFATALISGGTAASVIDVNPLEHEEINSAVGASGDKVVTPPLLEFLDACT